MKSKKSTPDATINERKRTNITPDTPAQAHPQALTQASAQPGRPLDLQKDQAILAAARELLFLQGPQAVTVEAVAAKAGVSKVTVYARHDNRDDLILAVIRSQADTFSANIALPQTSMAKAREALINFSLSTLNFLVSAEHLQFIRVVSAASKVPDAVLHEIYRQGALVTRQKLENWLQWLTDAGVIECPQPAKSAEAFVGMLIGLDMVRGLLKVPVESSQAELEARATFAVDGFLKMHAKPKPTGKAKKSR